MGVVESLKTLRSREADYQENIFNLERKCDASVNRAVTAKQVVTFQRDMGEWQKRLDDVQKIIKELEAAGPPAIRIDDDGKEYIIDRYVVCGNAKCKGDTGKPFRGHMLGSSLRPWFGAKCGHCGDRLGVKKTTKIDTGGKK